MQKVRICMSLVNTKTSRSMLFDGSSMSRGKRPPCMIKTRTKQMEHVFKTLPKTFISHLHILVSYIILETNMNNFYISFTICKLIYPHSIICIFTEAEKGHECHVKIDGDNYCDIV